MDLLDAAAQVGLVIGAVVHAGIVFTFAVLLNGRSLVGVDSVSLVRAFRACGAMLGISLGLVIFAGAWLWPEAVHPRAPGLDSWLLRWDTPTAQVQSLRAVLLGIYWVNYIAVEIWLLEPARLLDRGDQVEDSEAYERATDGVARGLGRGAALWLGMLVLSAF